MDKIKFQSLEKIIGKFSQARVLVVGDIIVDKYIWGKVTRISPEAPVPVVNVSKESYSWGGAANVAKNISTLGGQVFLAGVLGQDSMGEQLLADLNNEAVECHGILSLKERPTTLKTRIIAHSQQVVRVDYEVTREISRSVNQELIRRIKEIIPQTQAVVISDYAKGIIGPLLIKEIIDFARRHKIKVIVDPQITHYRHYKKVTVITPNHLEASKMSRIDIVDEKSLIRAGQHLLELLECEVVLITRGEEGMTLFSGDEYTHIPTVAREVFDVTGAGDTVTGVFALALAGGASFKEAAFLANYAASFVVAEVGTASVAVAKLKEAVKQATSKHDG